MAASTSRGSSDLRYAQIVGLKLKELTEGHHQEWSLLLNLTQEGKSPDMEKTPGPDTARIDMLRLLF